MGYRHIEFVEKVLTGYGGGKQRLSHVAQVHSVEECRLAIETCRSDGKTLSLVGANCSFGDQVLNEGGVVLDLTPMNAIEWWNPLTGRICVQAGVRIADILRITLLDGWCLPAIPGSLAGIPAMSVPSVAVSSKITQ